MLIIQFVVAFLVVILDQLVKLWSLNVLKPGGPMPIIEGVFNLRYVENTGAAFSMLEGKTAFLIIVPAIACVAMIYLLASRKINSKVGTWALTFVLAGAMGNLIDRIIRGAVVDLFDFELINFPVFNVADMAVTIGAVLFFIYVIFFYEDKKK